jgi:hypothetical protein
LNYKKADLKKNFKTFQKIKQLSEDEYKLQFLKRYFIGNEQEIEEFERKIPEPVKIKNVNF